MKKILANIFGQVLVNRATIITSEAVGEERLSKFRKTKKIASEYLALFIGNWLKIASQGKPAMTFYIVCAPFLNLFIFSGFFPFLITMVSNYAFFRIVMNKE